MSEISRVVKEISEKFDEALESEGFFITITRREGKDELKHFQARVNFLNDDVLPSINHIRGLLQKELGQDFKNLDLRKYN